MDIKVLEKALRASYAKDTAFRAWLPTRPSWGHCTVAALVVQDYLGGSILKASVKGGGTHYWNRLDNGVEIDFTADQFDGSPDRRDVKQAYRQAVLQVEHVKARYATFKDRVRKNLDAADTLEYIPWDRGLEEAADWATPEAIAAAREFLKSIRFADIFERGIAVTTEDHAEADITVAWNEDGEMQFGMTIISKGD
jgi:hypothetical protein